MRWLSLGIAATAAAALSLLWERIPPSWISHWGWHDRPDGWATKSPASVFAPLLLGAAVCVGLELLALVMRRKAQAAEPRVPAQMAEVQIELARAVGTSIMLLTAALALILPLSQPRSSLTVVLVAIVAIGGVMGPAFFWAQRRVRALRASGVAMPDGYGAFGYRNPNDPRLMVPKLMGLGWTLNFAHPAAWAVVAMLLLGPVVVVVVLSVTR